MRSEGSGRPEADEGSSYTYLVDVLQRVGLHPQARVHELVPRLWKEHFADDPLGSAPS